MNKNKVGLILGSFLGLVHLLWSVLVAVGIAQVMMDWIFKLHMLNNPYIVAAFDIRKAVILVVMTFVVGYAVGFVLALLWKMMHKAH